MRINFAALTGGASPDNAIVPRDIFSLLPSKAIKYQYLRDVQADVLNQWYERRHDKDLVLKMNTGSGKTVVGLLILKSCLNEGVGPAVYVAPSSYLLRQVEGEAHDLGIEVTTDASSARFSSGKAILLANIHKLINGKSVFGVGQEGIKLPIGSIVIDDAHACLTSSEDQFSLTVPSSNEAYAKLFALFESDLNNQSEPTTLDIKEGDSSSYLLVPYWAWLDKQTQILEVLHSIRKDSVAEFVWPLLVDHLQLSRCVISGKAFEITPHCLPISRIPAFTSAKRRLFMTAAFADDSILVSDFDVATESLALPINPSTAGDIGDRIILVPQELNPSITDDQLKAFVKQMSQSRNVVVLVPSEYRSRFWVDVADRTLVAGNLDAGVEELKSGHVGLVVLVNKYDGIDMPDDACRVLVVDGLPDVRKMIGKVEQSILRDSEQVISQSIQRIEQGMGRGIRSNEDYCAVLLMGASLTSVLYRYHAAEKLTPATLAQFKLSEQVSAQLRNSSLDDIGEVMDYCLSRNIQWVTTSRAATIHARYSAGGPLNMIPVRKRAAFNAASTKDYRSAISQIQVSVDEAQDPYTEGWLSQQLAEYQHPVNAVQAQAIQRQAVDMNNQLTRPIAGVAYVKMPTQQANQANRCISYLRNHFANPTEMVIEMNAYLDSLVFRPGTSDRFERTLAAVAEMIGFSSQRPEKEVGRGPDVLWSIGGLAFLVIECKNEATTDTINKKDCNQLAGSMNWFQAQYDETCSATPIMVHPSNVFERAATPHPDTCIMTAEKLPQLVDNLREFATGVAQLTNYGTTDEVGQLLSHLGLSMAHIVARFTVGFRPSR